MLCPVCETGEAARYRLIDRIDYFRCLACGSLFAHPDFLARADRGAADAYADAYWQNELKAARERCFGPALLRVAETIAYCRIPIRRFIDIGAGTGWLLDAVETLMPEAADRFHAVELYPPPPPHRTSNSRYIIGALADISGPFDAGVCIEVIEHLTPTALRQLAMQLGAISHPGSLYLFNSGQPDFVEHEDRGYLDPHGRGHVVSYSLRGATHIFGPAGFTIIPLPGRTWAFLAEFGEARAVSADALIARLWQVVPENAAMLAGARFGELMRSAGIDTARAYLPPGAVSSMSWREYLMRGWRAAVRLQGRVS